MEQEDLRRRQIQAHDEPIRKGSPVQEGDGSDGGEGTGHSGPDLPEDIWCHIHSLLSTRDAAQAACVSHAFLRSWRYRPNLTFRMETLGINKSACAEDEI